MDEHSPNSPRDFAKTTPSSIVEDLKTGNILEVLGDAPRIFQVGHRKVSTYANNGWEIYIWGGQRGENMIFISAEYAGGNHQIMLYKGRKGAGNTMVKLHGKRGPEIFVRNYTEAPEKQKPNYFKKPS